jgi:oxygen-independent coproporphyrinogen-3 oxidase
MHDWLEAVISEARSLKDSFSTFDTLYLGGGTPSVLPDRLIENLLERLRNVLHFDRHLEITMECNPGDLDFARASRLHTMGISRVSLGVQSFDDATLRFLGRRHDARCAQIAVEQLRHARFDHIGLDLIWGIPHLPVDRTLASVESALSFDPEHLSCYSLTVESATPLHKDVSSGVVRMKDDEALAEEAMRLWARLSQAGYDHYEVSNFARSPAYRSRHNTKYWYHTPVLELGPAAHSFNGSRRWANVSSVSDYVNRIRAGQRAVTFEEVLSNEQKISERVVLGLRTSDGVARSIVEGRRLKELQELGLLIVTRDRVSPTERGMLVADSLAVALDPT